MLKRREIDEVWLVLSPHNPLKDVAGLWDENKRLELITSAIATRPNIKVCTIEFTLPKPNYTINTLRTLSEQYPEHRFSILIGADNYAIFDKWRAYDEILTHYIIYVYPRRGVERQAGRFDQMIWIDDAPLFDVSSTEIRNRIARGEPIDDLIP